MLPKWRSGMRLTGLAHPALLLEDGRLETMLNQITGGARRHGVTYGRQIFSDFTYKAADGTDLTARLYAAQLFSRGGIASH